MLWFISLFNYADRQAVFSVFPLLEREMSLSTVELGWLGAAFAWMYGLGAPLAGWVVDRIRRKTAILGGLGVWSLICMATAGSRNFASLLAFRAAEGVGEAFYYPASNSMISDYHGPRTRSRALGFHQTAVYAGTIAGGFLAGWIGKEHGWRWSFIVFGGLGIVLALVLMSTLHEPIRERTRAAPVSMREVARIPTLLALAGAFLCANFVATVLLSWMPKFLYDRYHWDLATSGFAATAYVQLASMAGSPAGGWLADKLRRRTVRGRIVVQMAGVLFGAPFVVLCGMTHSVTWLLVALTCWGFFKGLYDANIFASAYDVIPAEARGRVVGWMNLAGWLGGGGSAPVVIGYIAQYTGLGTAIAFASVVYLAAGTLLLIAAVRVQRDSVT